MSKVEVLRGLLTNHPDATIYFVEDRLPTLLNVLKTDSLASVKLTFALWGYNTAEDTKRWPQDNPSPCSSLTIFLCYSLSFSIRRDLVC